MRGPSDFHQDLFSSVLEYAEADWRELQRTVDNETGRACRQLDPQDFFPPDGTRFLGHALFDERARVAELCQHCPVRRECLAGALLRSEIYGSWGGVAQPDYQILQRMWREHDVSREGAV